MLSQRRHLWVQGKLHQVAVLLQRAPALRQPAAVRDGPGVREDAAALRLHCYAAAAAGAGEAEEGQTAAGEANSDPHPLPKVSVHVRRRSL